MEAWGPNGERCDPRGTFRGESFGRPDRFRPGLGLPPRELREGLEWIERSLDGHPRAAEEGDQPGPVTNSNRAPPESLSPSSTDQPCASLMVRTMASPNPVPSSDVV